MSKYRLEYSVFLLTAHILSLQYVYFRSMFFLIFRKIVWWENTYSNGLLNQINSNYVIHEVRKNPDLSCRIGYSDSRWTCGLVIQRSGTAYALVYAPVQRSGELHYKSCGQLLFFLIWLSYFVSEPTSDTFVADLSRKLCKINMFVRGKYGPLCCLVNVIGARAMLEIHPRIPEDIMLVMTDQTVVPHVSVR